MGVVATTGIQAPNSGLHDITWHNQDVRQKFVARDYGYNGLGV